MLELDVIRMTPNNLGTDSERHNAKSLGVMKTWMEQRGAIRYLFIPAFYGQLRPPVGRG